MSNDPPLHRRPDPALFDTPGEGLDPYDSGEALAPYEFLGGSVWAAIVCRRTPIS